MNLGKRCELKSIIEIAPIFCSVISQANELTLRATLTLLACCKGQSAAYSSSPSSSELGSSEILASYPFRYTTKARLARNISNESYQPFKIAPFFASIPYPRPTTGLHYVL